MSDARSIAVPRMFEANQVGDGARRVEQYTAENPQIKIVRAAFDALDDKSVERVFSNEHRRSERRRHHQIHISLLSL